MGTVRAQIHSLKLSLKPGLIFVLFFKNKLSLSLLNIHCRLRNPFTDGIISPLNISNLSRKEETVYHRLRIGHTRLTQKYLFEQRGRIKIPPLCHFCDDPEEDLTVEHILIDCTEFRYVRRRYYRAPDLYHLFENTSPKQILGFLKEVNLFSEI